MGYPVPTLTVLQQQVLQDISAAQIQDSSGNLVDGLLRKAILRVMAWAQAGLAYLHYAYISWIAKQAVPWTATDEWLAGWGAMKGVLQEDATLASGFCTFTGAVGKDIPAGTLITRLDNFAYATTIDAPIASNGTATVAVTAQTTGSAGNADPGTLVYLSNSIEGVNAQGAVAAAGITSGADQETADAYRTRVLTAYAQPPQGGDRSDYIGWATAVSGVTRAWIAPNAAGAGSVTLYTMWDEANAATTGGFPSGTNGCAAADDRAAAASGDQLTVANAVAAEQPVTALVYSCAPVAAPVAFTITGLGNANTPANQAAIRTALADLFLRSGQVGGTVDPASGDAWPAIDPSAWYAAIGSVLGTSPFVVASPSAPISPGVGQLFVLDAANTSFAS